MPSFPLDTSRDWIDLRQLGSNAHSHERGRHYGHNEVSNLLFSSSLGDPNV